LRYRHAETGYWTAAEAVSSIELAASCSERRRVPPIGEAVAGDVVRIVGRAVESAGSVLALSGTPCRAQRVVVEQPMWSSEDDHWNGLRYRYESGGRYQWVRWIDEVSPADLLVEDATGVAICPLADARILHREPIQWLYGATPALTNAFAFTPRPTFAGSKSA
jgi:hypothetical protein